jgi:hypothetical protein
MQKPKPRTKFADEDDERMHLLDCFCWLQAEDISLDLEISQEECAEVLKQQVLKGRLVIEFDGDERARLIRAPSLAEH